MAECVNVLRVTKDDEFQLVLCGSRLCVTERQGLFPRVLNFVPSFKKVLKNNEKLELVGDNKYGLQVF